MIYCNIWQLANGDQVIGSPSRVRNYLDGRKLYSPDNQYPLPRRIAVIRVRMK